MERKKTKTRQFKKIGGGSFRLKNGKIIKPNQIFSTDPNEIPEAFSDSVIPLDPKEEVQEDDTKEEATEETTEETNPRFEILHQGSGWYNVVNTASGKAANSKKLRADAAQELLEELT